MLIYLRYYAINAYIYTDAINAYIYTDAINAYIYTYAINAYIYTYAINACLYTYAINAYIYTYAINAYFFLYVCMHVCMCDLYEFSSVVNLRFLSSLRETKGHGPIWSICVRRVSMFTCVNVYAKCVNVYAKCVNVYAKCVNVYVCQVCQCLRCKNLILHVYMSCILIFIHTCIHHTYMYIYTHNVLDYWLTTFPRIDHLSWPRHLNIYIYIYIYIYIQYI